MIVIVVLAHCNRQGVLEGDMNILTFLPSLSLFIDNIFRGKNVIFCSQKVTFTSEEVHFYTLRKALYIPLVFSIHKIAEVLHTHACHVLLYLQRIQLPIQTAHKRF